jgi:hypothetical protein
MTTLNRNNIPASIVTLEGLTAWACSTYTAAYGGKNYGERDSTDLQRFSRYSISPVESKENGTNLMFIARLAVPVNMNLLANGTIVWQGVVEHSQQAVLPSGYTV